MTWYLLALTSAALSAAAAVYEKKTLFNLGALEFSFLLAIANLVLSIPFFFASDFNLISLTSLGVLYFKTILGSLAFLCIMIAIKNLEISGSLPLIALTPGFVAVFAFVLLGESLSIYEISGIVLLILGTYILDMNGNNKLLKPFTILFKSGYHKYILFALLLFTTTSILDKVLLKNFKLPPYSFLAFQHLFLCVNFLLIVLFSKRKPLEIIKGTPRKYWTLILAVSVMTIGYRLTQIEAVKIANVALVLSVKRMSVFFAAIIGGKMFKEHKLLQRGIATLIILAGAIFILNH